MKSYQGINAELSELSELLSAAGGKVQRRAAEAIAEAVGRDCPVQRGPDALAELAAGRYGDKDFRDWLSDAQDVAHERYESLVDERDLSEEQDRDWPTAKQAELLTHFRAAATYEVFFYSLSADPEEAVQESAYVAHVVIGSDEVDAIVRKALAD